MQIWSSCRVFNAGRAIFAHGRHMMSKQDKLKQTAAIAAAREIESGMRLGLGTGSTMSFVLDEIARRIREERIIVVGIPTSTRTELRARQLGIPLTNFAETEALDLAIDGADELLQGPLTLIKGLGGALVRERIVAAAAQRFLVVVDHSKVVDRFASRAPVPVEVIAFGHQCVKRRIAELGMRPMLRIADDGAPVLTEGGNLLYDCYDIDAAVEPAALGEQLRRLIGVIDCGIFIGMATEAIVGDSRTAIRHLRRES